MLISFSRFKTPLFSSNQPSYNDVCLPFVVQYWEIANREAEQSPSIFNRHHRLLETTFKSTLKLRHLGDTIDGGLKIEGKRVGVKVCGGGGNRKRNDIQPTTEGDSHSSGAEISLSLIIPAQTARHTTTATMVMGQVLPPSLRTS